MSSSYGNSGCKDAVWNKAKEIKGKDPNLYRKDVYNNELYYNSYGLYSNKGWQIDHMKPKSKGGSDNIRNLQILQSSVNNKKSNSLVKKRR